MKLLMESPHFSNGYDSTRKMATTLWFQGELQLKNVSREEEFGAQREKTTTEDVVEHLDTTFCKHPKSFQ